jgi:hypothetical protein
VYHVVRAGRQRRRAVSSYQCYQQVLPIPFFDETTERMSTRSAGPSRKQNERHSDAIGGRL